VPDTVAEKDTFQVDVEIDDSFSGFSYTAEDGFAEMEKKQSS